MIDMGNAILIKWKKLQNFFVIQNLIMKFTQIMRKRATRSWKVFKTDLKQFKQINELQSSFNQI